MSCSYGGGGVDNFLEVGGLTTTHVKLLHYHAHFCMTIFGIAAHACTAKDSLIPRPLPCRFYLTAMDKIWEWPGDEVMLRIGNEFIQCNSSRVHIF